MLSRIQDDASVILASRAEITDFDAFLAIASGGRLRAVVDVFPEDPVPSSSVVRTIPNVLFTAHLAGGHDASYARIQDMMIEDISRIPRGQPCRAMLRADPNRAGQIRSRQVAGSSSPGIIQTRTWTMPSRTRASIIRRFRRAGSALASPVRASNRPWCNGHSMYFPSK